MNLDTPTGRAFYEALELYIIHRRGTLDDVGKAAARHLFSGSAELSAGGPCLGAIQLAVKNRGPIRRAIWACTLRYAKWKYRNRPLWNDFYMCMWALSREPQYVEALRVHLEQATDPMTIETGAWMIRSVCEQDPQFKELWNAGTD